MKLGSGAERVYRRAGRVRLAIGVSSAATILTSWLVVTPNDPRRAGPRAVGIALAGLGALWLVLLLYTWAHWGDVTIDSGREVYVPAALTRGHVLYRDVWYPYGPAAPYLNSVLFRAFGVNIGVAYAAGAAAALATSVTLFWCARAVSSLAAAFTVGYVVLLQAFSPGIFNYPFPYSYAAVYGSLGAALFLLAAVRTALTPGRGKLAQVGVWAGVALLMKLEFGVACLATLVVLEVGLLLRDRSWRALPEHVLELVPGAALCVITVAWMISIRGREFLTQDNFMSWPTSYFMRTYGQLWLRRTGFDLSLRSWLEALFAVAALVMFWSIVRWWAAHRARRWRVLGAWVVVVLGLAGVALAIARPRVLAGLTGNVLFPPHMVLVVMCAVPVVSVLFWRNREDGRMLAVLVVVCFAPLLAFRVLFNVAPRGYSIYYSGPVYVAFFVLLFALGIPTRTGPDGRGGRVGAILLVAAVCGWATGVLTPDYVRVRHERIVFSSEHGTIYLPKRMAPGWPEAVEFMRAARARGERVMSMPEDTALYFFAGVLCPTRVFAFTPGLLAPGRMTEELLSEIEAGRVRYLVISNRRFREYRAGEFGVDFDRPVGEYIESRYYPVGALGGTRTANAWRATIWERRND